MNIDSLSYDCRTWVRDQLDVLGKNMRLSQMDQADWEEMAEYLRTDDGSLRGVDQKFSEECADEIDEMLAEENPVRRKKR